MTAEMHTMMRVPLADLAAQYRSLQPEIDSAIAAVLASGRFIGGPALTTFESEFAEYLGARGAVGVASGTAAVHLAMLACGIGQGDEVITASHTFIATAEAISHAGATPVFADIDDGTYTLDPISVEAAITPRTRAIVAVHLYGYPCNMDALSELARTRGLALIEDAAQAHGAEYHGRRCGTLGDLASWSFFPAKNLGAYGDAGAVSGDDETLLARVAKLRDHGRSSKYEHDEIGFGERLDALQAAVLSVKLRRLEEWIAARRRIADLYRELLADLPLSLPDERPGSRHVYHQFVVRSSSRDELAEWLRSSGIEVGVHYPVPVHRQRAYAATASARVDLPKTDSAAAEILSLPIFPELTDIQIEYVTETIRAYFAR